MSYVIRRKEADALTGKKQWLLVYGRRKVGKTFLLKELCKFENYYAVKKDRGVIGINGEISMGDMIKEAKKLLSEGKTVVIDEFQRLEEGILEELALLHPNGKLILSGSSMRVARRIFEPQSPLLGFFTPFKIGFISPADMLLSLKNEFDESSLIEMCTFLREPWVIPIYNKERAIDFVYELITQSKYTIKALIGEIFTEEERELTKKYDAILSIIGSGIWNTRDLTSLLYARKLIPESSPTHVIQYLKNLEEIELVESIKMHKTKTKYYRIASPIMNIYYYLDSKYDISNRAVSLDEIRPTLDKLIKLEIQNFIADIFSELYNGRKEYFISEGREVDFIITRRNKPEIIGEVKWKSLSSEDISSFKKGSVGLYGKKVIICKDSNVKSENVEIISSKELIQRINNKVR